MDVLSDLLSLVKPNTTIAGGFDMCGDWSIAFEPHTGIKCFAVLSGSCWLNIEGIPIRLEAGACTLLSHGKRFCLTSNLSLKPVPYKKMKDIEWQGGIAKINGGGETLILGGHFAFAGIHADLLLGTIPPVAHLLRDQEKETLRWSLDLMRRELVEGKPGGTLVTQHLAHIVLLQALRLYLENSAQHRMGWPFALTDPQLSAALRAIHAEPSAPWNLSMLASKAGMSRASFAQAFSFAVGTSPIEYLTRWRMLLASDRLTRGNDRVSEIATSVGYKSESAFSTAFRRIMGSSPREYARSASQPSAEVHWGPGSVQ